MTKLAVINDTHNGIRNSADIFLENERIFYSEVLFPYLVENNIKNIIHLGDVFDNRKFINFKAIHSYRRNFLHYLREYGMHMDVIPGNHDTFYKSTNDLNSLKELLGHYMNEVTIHMHPTVVDYGCRIALIPWINAENEKSTKAFLTRCKADVVGGHFELSGFEMMKGITNEHGMDPKIFNRFEMVLSGHYHTKSSRNNIHYLGSQMEFFWSDAHDKKYFHVLDTDNRTLTAINNPNTLFHRIYYDDRQHDYTDIDISMVDNKFVKVVVINKADPYMFDRFIDRIQNRKIHELKIAESFTEFVGNSVDDSSVSVEDTPTLLNSYIDAVDTDLDKDRIKTQMYDLMIEAQTLEIQ